ncbi:MAG: DUF3794 domain-containing protein [Lachnospiraceae bacterium]|nr:DUF3794 domain-containing protein [Lachnospiraceae bacterium]
MELVKKNIHMDFIKAKAATQLVLEDDMNLPDVKPDMDCICLEKGNVVIEEAKAYADSVTVRGRLVFQVLYHTDEESHALATVEGKIAFEEKLHMPGITAADTVKAEGSVEDLSIGIINSRKLSIQSVVNLVVCAEEIYDEEVPIGLRGEEGIEYRRSPMEMAKVAVSKNDIYRIRDEVLLPNNYPNIFQVLWSNLSLDDVEFRPLDEKLSVRGELKVQLIYECVEGRIHSFETSIPFSGNMDCSGCRESMIPTISYGLGQQEVSIRPDRDGEERVVAVDAMLDMALKMYEEAKVELITDVYGVKAEVIPVEKEVSIRRLLTRTTGKQKVTEHVKVGAGSSSILQLLHSEGRVLLDKVEVGKNAITLKGSIPIQVLYISGDDRKPYDALRTQIPYKYEMEINGIEADDTLDVQASLEQMQVSILDGEELDVKAVPVFTVTAFGQERKKLVSDITTEPLDTKKLGVLPGMAIYTVKPGDSLWSIGKKYYISVDRLKKINELSSDDLQIGQKLLIVKEGI